MDELPPARSPRTPAAPDRDSNFVHLYADVFWYGVLAGSAVAFLSVYAARLGATSFQVGLLTSGPAVANLLVSLPVGRWLEGRSLTRAAFYSSLGHRAGYLALILLPWLLSSAGQIWAMVLIALVISLPGTALAIAFNAMFADVVPPELRGLVVGRRNALVAISLSATSVLCGWLLDQVAFPLNYQIVFGLGALGAGMSSYHLGRIRGPAAPPPRAGRPLLDAAQPGQPRFLDAARQATGLRFLARSSGRPLLRLDLLRSAYGPFLFSYLLFYTCQFVPVPIAPLFWVRILHLTDADIGLGSAVYHGMMLVASMGLARISARFGHRRVLLWGGLFSGVYPLLLGLARDPSLYWAASLLGGGVWALASGGLVNRLMERVPEDDRPAHMALHNLALNLGILGGSLLGPALETWLGLRHALLLSAGLRLLAGIALAIWG